MPTKKPRVTFAISQEALTKIEDYQRDHRIKNQSQAILRLLERGLGEPAGPDLSREALRLAQAYDALDPLSRKALRGLAAVERERTAPEEKPLLTLLPKAKHRSDGFVEIKVYDQPAAAGLGNYLDEPASHMEQYPSGVIPSKADFGIRLSGDSMEPKLHDGSTVFVQASVSLQPGRIGIFVLNGKAYCKRLAVDKAGRQVRLVSENPAYGDIILRESDDLRTVGLVLGQYPE